MIGPFDLDPDKIVLLRQIAVDPSIVRYEKGEGHWGWNKKIYNAANPEGLTIGACDNEEDLRAQLANELAALKERDATIELGVTEDQHERLMLAVVHASR